MDVASPPPWQSRSPQTSPLARPEPEPERSSRPSRLSPRARAALIALARAVVPAGRLVRAGGPRTVDAAEAHLDAIGVDPRLAGALASALDLAALASTGRTLKSLDPERADALVRRWEESALMRHPLFALASLLKLVHFDDPAFYARKRVPYARGGPSEPARWTQQARPLGASGEASLECDVVVVGTGAGGAVVGKELADRGHAVVFLEEGDLHLRDSFRGRALDAHARFYRGHGAIVALGRSAVPIFMGRMVGGSTAINGGTCFRTPDRVLEGWCERLGTDELSPRAMVPYFERVERALGVAPGPLAHVGGLGRVAARGFDRLGWRHFPLQRNAPDCDGQGCCDFGCPSAARRSVDLSYVPVALARGAVLRTGAKADEIVRERGRAVGVVARDAQGRALRVRARAVVLACGAIPTPLLLLGQGLGGRSGQLGRNLSLHPSAAASALFPEGETVEQHRSIPQGYGCDEFHDEGILLLGAGAPLDVAPALFPFAGRRFTDVMDAYDRVASFAAMIEDESRGRVRRGPGGAPLITYRMLPRDVAKLQRGLACVAEMFFAAGAERVFPLSRRVPFLDGRRALARFRDARLSAADLIVTSFHPIGTCRMGRDPDTSVVGLDHEVHDVPGLFVVDGSTVPGPPAVNPQVTIMAMATRAAERIDARLG